MLRSIRAMAPRSPLKRVKPTRNFRSMANGFPFFAFGQSQACARGKNSKEPFRHGSERRAGLASARLKALHRGIARRGGGRCVLLLMWPVRKRPIRVNAMRCPLLIMYAQARHSLGHPDDEGIFPSMEHPHGYPIVSRLLASSAPQHASRGRVARNGATVWPAGAQPSPPLGVGQRRARPTIRVERHVARRAERCYGRLIPRALAQRSSSFRSSARGVRLANPRTWIAR